MQKKQPVYMQHGLADDGGTWFFNSDGTFDLAFELVDAGYDVWSTNNRGTVFSNMHTKLTTDDPEFWDFTFDEMAKFDVPANLNYILSQTGADQVIYIGHSQGTSQWLEKKTRNPPNPFSYRLISRPTRPRRWYLPPWSAARVSVF